MIDVIYLVKDKNRCHVYEPPQGLEISGPEARPPATAVRTQSIGVRARSQWAWHLARKLLPLEGHARAGRPGLRCGRPAPGDRRERSAAAVPLVAALRIPTVRSNSAFLRLSSRISRAVSVGPPSPGRHRAIFLPSEGDVHETRDGSFRERGKGWCIAARRQALGYGLAGPGGGCRRGHTGLVGTPTAP